jgi:uncharacterized repeat protein (TIGR01451 family)
VAGSAHAGAQTVDLALALTAEPDPVSLGDELVYTLAVENRGPDVATAVVLRDELPPQAELRAVEPTQGSCSGTSDIACELGELAPGATAVVTIRAQVLRSGELRNAATVASAEPDANAGDNAGAVTTQAVPIGVAICLELEVARTTLTLGARTVVPVTVRRRGLPLRGVRVVAQGAGTRVAATSGRRGVARLAITPLRSGILRLSVLNQPLCRPVRLGVLARHQPPLTG